MKNNKISLLGGMVLIVLSSGVLAETDRLPGQTTHYDVEYPQVDYSGAARDNRIWRLQQKLNSGEVKLQWDAKGGYLRSLLRALEIDPSSQTMVFSKTSLQTTRIAEKTPRAIYFNDDTYVGFVQNSDLLEFASVDAKKGVVFFGMINRQDTAPTLEREGGRCLTCHDTYSMKGGGVPRVVVMSAPVDDPSETRNFDSASEVDDRTPIAERWGGWYLSGWYFDSEGKGTARHFGNLALRGAGSAAESAELQSLRKTRENRGSVTGYINASPYLTDKSDVVALLVMEHQTYVQNLITRVQYKAPNVLARESGSKAESPNRAIPTRWSQIPPAQQAALKQIIEPLVRAMFFADAAPLAGQVVTSSGFTERFAQRGPRDSQGRSLRELNLNGRLMEYPLSFMIYSESLNALPPYALDYLDMRIVEVLQGRDTTGVSDRLDIGQRAALGQILAETMPRFAKTLGRHEQSR